MSSKSPGIYVAVSYARILHHPDHRPSDDPLYPPNHSCSGFCFTKIKRYLHLDCIHKTVAELGSGKFIFYFYFMTYIKFPDFESLVKLILHCGPHPAQSKGEAKEEKYVELQWHISLSGRLSVVDEHFRTLWQASSGPRVHMFDTSALTPAEKTVDNISTAVRPK